MIVDEIHAVAGDKRGAHLALSLERLDALAGRRLQRIGLSATQKPIEDIARLLVGAVSPSLPRKGQGGGLPQRRPLPLAGLAPAATQRGADPPDRRRPQAARLRHRRRRPPAPARPAASRSPATSSDRSPRTSCTPTSTTASWRTRRRTARPSSSSTRAAWSNASRISSKNAWERARSPRITAACRARSACRRRKD